MLRPLPPRAWLAGALVPLFLGSVPPVAVADSGSPSQWCRSARDQVLDWSATHAADRGRPYVTEIRKSRTALDRVIDPPTDGIVLRCRGQGLLSNGVTTGVKYGFRSIDGSWYLFLKRAR